MKNNWWYWTCEVLGINMHAFLSHAQSAPPHTILATVWSVMCGCLSSTSHPALFLICASGGARIWKLGIPVQPKKKFTGKNYSSLFIICSLNLEWDIGIGTGTGIVGAGTQPSFRIGGSGILPAKASRLAACARGSAGHGRGAPPGSWRPDLMLPWITTCATAEPWSRPGGQAPTASPDRRRFAPPDDGHRIASRGGEAGEPSCGWVRAPVRALTKRSKGAASGDGSRATRLAPCGLPVSLCAMPIRDWWAGGGEVGRFAGTVMQRKGWMGCFETEEIEFRFTNICVYSYTWSILVFLKKSWVFPGIHGHHGSSAPDLCLTACTVWFFWNLCHLILLSSSFLLLFISICSNILILFMPPYRVFVCIENCPYIVVMNCIY
jgi:hypothetical protein